MSPNRSDRSGLTIIDLHTSDAHLIDQIAGLMVVCFRQYSPSWLPNEHIARRKVLSHLSDGHPSRVLLDQNGAVLGWIGAIAHKHTWEIHPLAVSFSEQRKGYGTLLVDDISAIAVNAGVVSVWAGTGDETGTTSFSSSDLYNHPARALDAYTVPDNHPVNFWLKAGFSIVGFLPDEEGLGKPGIHLAKRIV